MAGFDWTGFRNETHARQTELARIIGTAQGTVSKRISSMYIENWELEALINHYGRDVVGKYQKEVEATSGAGIIMVPVISLDARGGFSSNEELGTEYVTELMPFSKSIATDGDFIISIYGESMTPKYPSGCMVLVRKVEMWQDYLELGATYVLELVDGRRIMKNIKKSSEEGCVLLESVNPKFEPTDISQKMIRFVFRVIMSIQREVI